MAKVKMTCPITKGPCTECSIYRGRHFYLCFSKEYHGTSLGEGQINELKAHYKKERETGKKDYDIPALINDIPVLIDNMHIGSKFIKNVEELVISADKVGENMQQIK